MAREHSFTITLSNNRTEKAGFRRLLKAEPNWVRPDKDGRARILKALGLPQSFSRAFDLIWIKGRRNPQSRTALSARRKDIVLIELKSTKARLPDNPHKFFFGATKNEFKLAKRLGPAFRFCFVCLHRSTPSHKLLTLDEVEGMIQNKRVQYQINLR